MTAPCNCNRAGSRCTCSWRDHLTKPLRVEVPWLYDDGRVTHDATLSGLVYPEDHAIDEMTITLDDGETVDVPREDKGRAGDDLRWAADDMWRSCA